LADVGTVDELNAPVVVEIMVRDLARSLDFYRRLGFRLERRTDRFASLRWGTQYFFVAEDSALPPPAGPSRANLRLIVGDVDDEWQKVNGMGATVESGIADRPYGLRDFTILDPDGFGIRFASPTSRKRG